jgi:hypothetical protein
LPSHYRSIATPSEHRPLYQHLTSPSFSSRNETQSCTMVGKVWSVDEERHFWTVAMASSPKRVGVDRARPERSWIELAGHMQRALAERARRQYTGTMMCKSSHFLYYMSSLGIYIPGKIFHFEPLIRYLFGVVGGQRSTVAVLWCLPGSYYGKNPLF